MTKEKIFATHTTYNGLIFLITSWHGRITPWQTEGEKVEAVTDFILLGSKITADGDCNHEIKRRLLLGRKAMTNIDSVL